MILVGMYWVANLELAHLAWIVSGSGSGAEADGKDHCGIGAVDMVDAAAVHATRSGQRN